ncbi:putative ribonuclease H-like domain-containing protein [Tanacetum coccineum]|uniref:Ribonuclease H-like domain-containing protein n=1 Tax=Tanacetum coccineum TaxID=301880 RepID=A0ABQ5EUC2_9ASTR
MELVCFDANHDIAAIKARFEGNQATKRTQKALLKQQYENFNASSSESLDSIFKRLQKLVSRLAILSLITPLEDLNVKFLRSLPSEWDTHVVVWMNKPDFFDKLWFWMICASSINNINIVNPEVSTGTTKVNTASTETSTASFSDATKIWAFFVHIQPKGSQQARSLSRTERKIIIYGSSTAVMNKTKVECKTAPKNGTFCPENQSTKESRQQKLESRRLIKGVEKKTVIPTATKKEFVKPETPVRRSVSCPNVHKHMVPRAVLMKTGLKTVNNARPVNTVREKGIKREYSVARTPQQNGVAERKNRTLIEAARTMLADILKLPITFWQKKLFLLLANVRKQGVSRVLAHLLNRRSRLIGNSIFGRMLHIFEESHDGSNLKDNGTADQQVNTQPVTKLILEEPKRISQALRDPAIGRSQCKRKLSSVQNCKKSGFCEIYLKVIEQLVQSGSTETRKMKGGLSSEIKQDLLLKNIHKKKA